MLIPFSIFVLRNVGLLCNLARELPYAILAQIYNVDALKLNRFSEN